MRLQKYMAMCGVAARRKCEEIIASGRVAVNGQTVTQMGTQVEDGDEVTLDGRRIVPEETKRYILYHKPAGEVTTVSDDKGRETVMDRFAGIEQRLYPVGRLDYDSEGLLLLTNDGELAQRLTHPSCEVDKVYLARVSGNPTNEEIDRLRTELQDMKYKALSTSSKLTEKSRQSRVLEMLKNNKDSVLKIAGQPPYIIEVKE